MLTANGDETILVNVPKYIKAAESELKDKKSNLKKLTTVAFYVMLRIDGYRFCVARRRS